MSTIYQETKSDTFKCPHLDKPAGQVLIDPGGDLHLIVGRNRCRLSLEIQKGYPFEVLVTKNSEGYAVLKQEHRSFDETVNDHDSDANDSTGAQSERTSDIKKEEDADHKDSWGLLSQHVQERIEDAARKSHSHDGAVEYVVCSRALCRSSLFFKRLLCGNFAESKRPEDNSQWTVHLPDDDLYAMELILHIAHGIFSQVPLERDLSTVSFYQLTITTDKYDLTHLLRPFARGWIKAQWELNQQQWTPTTREDCRLLWGAWELGDKDVFWTMIDLISARSSLDTQGQLVYHDIAWECDSTGALFEDVLEPPRLLGK